VQAVAAALLITAAILKTYQAVAQPNLASSQFREFLLIGFELVLGAALLLGVWPKFSWALALLTFTIFAGVSARKAMMGSSSCGCFGFAAVNPRVMVVIDLVMVALLFWSGARSAYRDHVTSFQRFAHRAGVVVLSLLMLTVVAAGAYALLPKAGIVADAAEYDFGTISMDRADQCDHTFVIRNTARRPLKITGSRSSCACTLAEVPSSPIAPGETAEVRVRANWSGVTGQPYAQVTLLTDSYLTPRVPLVIHGTVIK
jgi:hypothetical protein